ncbi:MAG: choice-of-anchor Q domain-containing protein [Planctomycetales bacterium]
MSRPLRAADVLEERTLLTTITVTTSLEHEEGKTSLREAINTANQDPDLDTIRFSQDLAGQTVHLTQGQLNITATLEINGLGARNTTITADGQSRVFTVQAGSGDVTLSGMTITGGRTTADNEKGAGIQFLSGGTLTVIESVISSNQTGGFEARGAGIYTFTGAVIIRSSLISGNQTTGSGGDGAGIFSQNGPVTLENSTMTLNGTAGYHADGAAIYTDGVDGAVTLTSSTVSANINNGPGAMGAAVSVVRGSVNLSNSIISGNTISAGNSPDLFFGKNSDSATFQSRFSLIGVNAGTPLNPTPPGTPDANGNLVGSFVSPLDAQLTTLAENGGLIPTMALLDNSPAINAGEMTTAFPFDQRGPTYERLVSGRLDMGAFERQSLWQLNRRTGLAGFYYDDAGHVAQVLQNGSDLTLVNGLGGRSPGVLTNEARIDAPDFNLTGVFHHDLGRIDFSDGSAWVKVRQVAGEWLTGIGKVAGIRQVGTALTFTGGTGSKSSGSFLSATKLVAADWGNIEGTLTNNGQRISWSNGTFWNLIPDFGGNWINLSGRPTRIEQQGTQLLFVNASGGTSLGRYANVNQVDAGDAWGHLSGTIVGQSIQWANGTTWSLANVNGDRPDLGGLWQGTTGDNVRVLQADEALTFVNASGQTSPGKFLSSTEVLATGWNQQGLLVGNQIQWANSTTWTRYPDLAGAYIDDAAHETGINQLERTLTITDAMGTVTQGNLIDPTHIEVGGNPPRTAIIQDRLITWNDGSTWTGLPTLSGNWTVTSSSAPAYTEQAGLSLLFLTELGIVLTGHFVSPTEAEVTQVGLPNTPTINVGVVDARTLHFPGGVEWKKFPPTLLDDVFADPNAWPYL